MPHQCTNCGETFDDGSKEMLSGCPECGGHKFQFRPTGAGRTVDADAADGTDAAGDAPAAHRRHEASGADADRRSSREWVSQRRASSPDGAADRDSVGDPDAPGAADTDAPASDDGNAPVPDDRSDDLSPEDRAQADARGGVVSPNELSEATADAAVSEAEEDSSDDGPDLSELREELNSQFESIRIVSPGQYELNLMELYDRQEYIISLREDGRYVIEVPETWRAGGE